MADEQLQAWRDEAQQQKGWHEGHSGGSSASGGWSWGQWSGHGWNDWPEENLDFCRSCKHYTYVQKTNPLRSPTFAGCQRWVCEAFRNKTQR